MSRPMQGADLRQAHLTTLTPIIVRFDYPVVTEQNQIFGAPFDELQWSELHVKTSFHPP